MFVLAATFTAAQPASPRRSGGDAVADRLVAERVLRLGGTVILEGENRPIVDLDELPDTDFRLHTLDLVGVTMGAWGLKDELSRGMHSKMRNTIADLYLTIAEGIGRMPPSK